MIKVSTKWRVLMVVIAIPLVAVGITRLKDSLKDPSAEMLRLRQIESSLSFPVPERRHEEDRGCYRDGKGTVHYAKHISLSYKSLETAREVKKILESKRWNLKSTNSFEKKESYTFTDEAQNARVYMQFELEPPFSPNALPQHYVAIHAITEEKCDSVP
jgi:hypothetical protein